jgi:hypothetical protein
MQGWRLRFHLGTLVILVLVLAVGLAALRESSDNWDSPIFTLTLGALLVSILLAVHRTARKRAFWVGFAIFGAGYLGLTLVPSIESRLLTTKALAYLDSLVPRWIPAGTGLAVADYDNDGKVDLYVINNLQPPVLYLSNGNDGFVDVSATAGVNLSGNQPPGSGTPLNSAGLWLRGSVGTTENFVRIGQSLFALIVALAGGQLSRHLYAKKWEPAQGPVNPPESTATGPGVMHPQCK